MRYNLVSSDLNDLEKYIDNYTWEELLETLKWFNDFFSSKGDNKLFYTMSTTDGLKALVSKTGWDVYEFIDKYCLEGLDSRLWFLCWDGKTLSRYSSINGFILSEMRRILVRYYNELTEEDILYHKMSDSLPKILQDADEVIKGRLVL